MIEKSELNLPQVDELRAFLTSLNLNYPEGTTGVPDDPAETISGLAFFPGGSGRWVEKSGERAPKTIPKEGIMVLGNNWGTVQDFMKCRKMGEEPRSYGTWPNLVRTLRRADIPLERCFFTNAYMGLMEGESNLDSFPNTDDQDGDFVNACREFFHYQLRIQQPSLIIGLGSNVREFLARSSDELGDAWPKGGNFNELDKNQKAVLSGVGFQDAFDNLRVNAVLLTHPSMPNQWRRSWKGVEGQEYRGRDAEVAMAKFAWSKATERPVRVGYHL